MTIHDYRKTTLAQLRIILIRSFIEALRISSSFENIKSGFSSTGLCPIDPSVPLSSKLLLPQVIRPSNQNYISNKFLNSEDNLPQLFEKEFGRKLTQADMINNLKLFIHNQYHHIDVNGIALSPCPAIICTDISGAIHQIA